MKRLIIAFSFLISLSICFGCNPATHSIKFDCDYSKKEIVETKEGAVEIANYFLVQCSTTNYYKDSVFVEQLENGDFQVSFKVKGRQIPDDILLIVRKDDGCVAVILQE